MPARIGSLYHHSSHRSLLTAEPSGDAQEAGVDAVVVPAGRPVSWLRAAIWLADGLRCPLIVLCSRAVTGHEVAALGLETGVTTIGIDASPTATALPILSTAELVAQTPFKRDSDVSSKRNTALALSRVAGWERVLFLDDDITGVDPADVRAAAGLLDRYSAVGLDNVGYPDNSVVCHFFREVGTEQQQFVGSGGLIVSPTRTRSMFPDIYNQDWFFLIGEGHPLRVAVTGSMRQKDFDPFADPRRAREEEFGDCLAEGLYWLLDQDSSLDDAGIDHWRDFLHRRRAFIESLISRARRLAIRGQYGRRRLASLRAAHEACVRINPRLCVEYVNRWRQDLDVWRQYLDELPTGLGIDGALREFGLAEAAYRSNV